MNVRSSPLSAKSRTSLRKFRNLLGIADFADSVDEVPSNLEPVFYERRQWVCHRHLTLGIPCRSEEQVGAVRYFSFFGDANAQISF
jgi:hypothetical protein